MSRQMIGATDPSSDRMHLAWFDGKSDRPYLCDADADDVSIGEEARSGLPMCKSCSEAVMAQLVMEQRVRGQL